MVRLVRCFRAPGMRGFHTFDFCIINNLLCGGIGVRVGGR